MTLYLIFNADDMLPWIQVDFNVPTLLTGIVTQGRPTVSEEWVETFKIQYGNNQTDLNTITNESGTDIVSTAAFPLNGFGTRNETLVLHKRISQFKNSNFMLAV